MFERFTASARMVVIGARHETQVLGHGTTGSGHLLLALHQDSTGAGGRALRALDVRYDDLRACVSRLEDAAADERAPKRGGLLSRLRPTGSAFSAPARTSLEKSLRAALALNHGYIGTGHVLIGVLGAEDGAGRAALDELGVDIDALRDSAERAAATERP